MPLRPINAIFIEPKQKFIVVYQHGELWRLPRMKIDMDSWKRREEYKGERNAIFVSKKQKILDNELAKELPTEELPTTIYHTSLNRFEDWWLANGYEWSIKRKEAENSINEKQSNETSTSGKIIQIPTTTTHSEGTDKINKTEENSSKFSNQSKAMSVSGSQANIKDSSLENTSAITNSNLQEAEQNHESKPDTHSSTGNIFDELIEEYVNNDD